MHCVTGTTTALKWPVAKAFVCHGERKVEDEYDDDVGVRCGCRTMRSCSTIRCGCMTMRSTLMMIDMNGPDIEAVDEVRTLV